MNFTEKSKYTITDLLEIIRILRGKDGCPWDREQDHHSIRRNVLEEAYEVAEAIDLEDPQLLKEELGDLLMQVVFHAHLEQEAGSFSFDDICDSVCRKLIIRHPHVFSSTMVADNSETVLQNWEAIKRKTKGQASVTESLRSIPSLPSLMKSEKLQSRAAKAGFDPFTETTLQEEIASACKQLRTVSDTAKRRKLLSGLFFNLVALCRKWGLDPEQLLADSDSLFIERFSRLEELCEQSHTDLAKLSKDEAVSLWEQVGPKHR